MENLKKYEMYTNNKKIGVLKVFSNCYKRAVSMSIAGIIAVSTLSGCSFMKTNNITSYEISFDNIDDEIAKKYDFIESCLNNIEVEQLNNMILEPYKKAKSIEFDLDPNSNEYYSFYTEEDINVKKRNLVSNLDASIYIIEKYTGRRFSEEVNNTKVK